MGMDANQALLSMMLNPAAWYHAEFMYLKKDNDSLHNLLGIEKGAKYVKAIVSLPLQGIISWRLICKMPMQPTHLINFKRTSKLLTSDWDS